MGLLNDLKCNLKTKITTRKMIGLKLKLLEDAVRTGEHGDSYKHAL